MPPNSTADIFTFPEADGVKTKFAELPVPVVIVPLDELPLKSSPSKPVEPSITTPEAVSDLPIFSELVSIPPAVFLNVVPSKLKCDEP